MEILFVSTELAPYVKIGGLADVAAALPKALRGLGHKVTILAPRFPEFEAAGLLMARRLTPMKISLGARTFDVTVFDGRLPSQVDLVLVDVANPTPQAGTPGMFDRGGVYGKGGEDFADNGTRFAVLSRAAVEIAKARALSGNPYDIIHGNDWPAALIPTYKKEAEAEVPALASTRTVLTIHNVAHQGVFPREIVPELGLPWELFDIEHLEFYGKANLLKLGIVAADVVTTVSPTYAREISTAGSGHGLEGVLLARGSSLVGILNGVDYAVWNPATDAALPARYDAEDLTNKARCRGALQRELGLALDPAVPLVANVGRIVHQKGTDLVAAAIPRLLRATDVQIVVCGEGDAALAKKLEEAAQKSDRRAVFVRAASEQVVHRVFAAADIVLVPSRFEPCGLVQMYAQRYGALPVARATGGIVDTVVDCDAKLETGTGFLFQEDTVEALVAATERAIAARTSPRWPLLVRRAMRLDRGWERPARQYEQLYRQLVRS